jgi:hypothetical protein
MIPLSFVDQYQNFGGHDVSSSPCTLEKEAAGSFETPVFIYQTTLFHIWEEYF